MTLFRSAVGVVAAALALWLTASVAAALLESNNHVVIGKENYFLSADGFLMPTKKDQAPPDLRYFQQTRK